MDDNIKSLFTDSQNVLIAGAGGGFDIYAGLPICHTLEAMGKTVHLSNYSFSNFNICASEGDNENLTPTLRAVHGNVASVGLRGRDNYYPEGYLAQCIQKPVYMIQRQGVKPTLEAYKKLVDLFAIDTIVLIDGGVDSIFTGTEQECGTILDDAVNLAAVSQLKVKQYLACVGFGTEAEDGVSHYHALANMAALIYQDAFYGSYSLLKGEENFKYMKRAYEYCVSHEGHAKSHITPRIIDAVEGNFGRSVNDPPNLLISPLMGVYWWFNAWMATKNNQFINSSFLNTTTNADVLMVYRQFLAETKLSPRQSLPY